MEDLAGYRREIDEIDSQLIPLFERRMDVVREVARFKKVRNMQVLQRDRERVVLDKAVARLRDPGYAAEAERFMNAVMAISRAAQRRDIGGALPREAAPLTREGRVLRRAGLLLRAGARRLLRRGRERTACAEFEDVFTALRDGEIDYGVLPIENSSTGAITRVYDLLGSYGFFIVGERRLRIHQNLVGVAGATLDTVRAVYSHEQGLEQSSRFLAEHPGWEQAVFHSTR